MSINHNSNYYSELFREAVESEINDYFSGKGSRHNHWAKKGIDINLLGAASSKYIALYNLVQWAWQPLTRLHPLVLSECKSPREVMLKSIREFSGDFQLVVVTACRKITNQSKCPTQKALLEAFDVADEDMARETLEIVLLRDEPWP